MEFKLGQKVRLLVHGAGVTSEEVGVIGGIGKKGLWLVDEEDRLFDAKTGKTGVLDFGFSFEILPIKEKKKKKT